MKVYDGSQATEDQAAPDPERIKVGIAELETTTETAVLTTSGLGSCVGVSIYDESTGAAGLLHVMLPTAAESIEDGNRAKFADTGVEALVEALRDAGASADTMRAKIAGGSHMLDFSESGPSIGERNAEQVRETLETYSIPIVGEDVGGEHGRSLRLDTATGDLVVNSANADSNTL